MTMVSIVSEVDWRLERACANNEIDAAASAIAQGADVNRPIIAPDVVGMFHSTLLYWACVRKQIEIVRLLLANGADPNATIDIAPPTNWGPGHESTALSWGADNEEIAQLLLDAGADPNLPLSEPAFLYATTEEASEKTVKQLVAGANLDFRTPYGSVLAMTADRGRAEIVRLLLDWGMAPEIVVQRTFEHESLVTYELETLRVLLEAGGDPTPGLWAINMEDKDPDAQLATLLLEYGANVNDTTEHGWSILHSALMRHDTTKIKFLLQHGASRALPPGFPLNEIISPGVLALVQPRPKGAGM